MRTLQHLFTLSALFICLARLDADPLVYVVSGPPVGAAQFGYVDAANGTFTKVGGDIPGSQGLVQAPDGSFLTLTYAGDLASINPQTGALTVIGATGLTDCSLPGVSPCGPHSANGLGSVGGRVYVTDFSNNLFTVNTTTGAATLVGATGIPAVPFTPVIPDPDGTFGFLDEALFGSNGMLYATFDAGILDPSTFTPTKVIDPKLYRIDPLTGAAVIVGDTDFTVGAVTGNSAIAYAFENGPAQLVTLDPATGHTTFVANFDPGIGIVTGAAILTPEPAAFPLAALGCLALFVCSKRR